MYPIDAIRQRVASQRYAVLGAEIHRLQHEGLNRREIRVRLGVSDKFLISVIGRCERAPRHDRTEVPSWVPDRYRQTYLRYLRMYDEYEAAARARAHLARLRKRGLAA